MQLPRPLRSAVAITALLLTGALVAQEIDTGEGAAVYGAQCAACHGPAGTGVPGAFPPLAGHVYEFQVVDDLEEGRAYPILVVLYGLMGPITVADARYNGMMPPMAHLTDEQIADVLNFVMVEWDDVAELEEEFEPYTPEEVEEQRGRGLTPADVHAIRQALGLD
jgi:mono/diheme cytochrome c family protein